MSRLTFFCLLAFLLPPVRATAADPTAEEILVHLRNRRDQMEDLALEARWTEFKDGKAVAVEEQVICLDNLGRIRVQYEYGSEAASSKEVDNLYNGEITVNAVEDPNRNRLGEPHTGAGGQPNDRYLGAMIYDGLFPVGRGPGNHRNPFTFFDGPATRHLKRLLEAGRNVEVNARDENGEVFELRYRLSPEDDPYRMHHVVVVDAGKGWVVTSAEQYFPDSEKLARRETCQYEADSNGVWLPSRGCWQYWGERDVNDTPEDEWRFEVRRIALNDPQFDQSVFEVALKPGTYVNDMRFDVAYWVGEEGAIGSDLTALAQEAAAEKAAERRRLEPQPADISEGGVGRTRALLIGISALVFVALVSLWCWRRFAKR